MIIAMIVATVVMAIMKLLNWINWSWWAVCFPVLLFAAVFVVVVVSDIYYEYKARKEFEEWFDSIHENAEIVKGDIDDDE